MGSSGTGNSPTRLPLAGGKPRKIDQLDSAKERRRRALESERRWRTDSGLLDGGDSDTATEAEEDAVASVVNGQGVAAAVAAGFELRGFAQVRVQQLIDFERL